MSQTRTWVDKVGIKKLLENKKNNQEMLKYMRHNKTKYLCEDTWPKIAWNCNVQWAKRKSNVT
jgi:hypothetical protein